MANQNAWKARSHPLHRTEGKKEIEAGAAAGLTSGPHSPSGQKGTQISGLLLHTLGCPLGLSSHLRNSVSGKEDFLKGEQQQQKNVDLECARSPGEEGSADCVPSPGLSVKAVRVAGAPFSPPQPRRHLVPTPVLM